MFTKAEYAQYFQMISEKEQAMVFALEKLIPNITEVALSFELEDILRQELAHNKLVCELIDGVMNPPTEARASTRTHVLGEARLSRGSGGEAIVGHCLDFSLGGLCVEVGDQLAPGTRFDVAARFYETGRSSSHRAVVSWCRQAGPGRFRAGLRFEDA